MNTTLEHNKTPQICSNLVFLYEGSAQIEKLMSELVDCLGYLPPSQKYGDLIQIEIAETGYIDSWELDEVLKIMFQKIDSSFSELISIFSQYEGSFFVDIAFYHDERYPSLIIEGAAMEKIRQLKADIGIDAY